MTEQADPRIAEMITKVFSSFLKKKKKFIIKTFKDSREFPETDKHRTI